MLKERHKGDPRLTSDSYLTEHEIPTLVTGEHANAYDDLMKSTFDRVYEQLNCLKDNLVMLQKEQEILEKRIEKLDSGKAETDIPSNCLNSLRKEFENTNSSKQEENLEMKQELETHKKKSIYQGND